ncbi:unnamed protein product [Gordionus sp. m RMFG-2023]
MLPHSILTFFNIILLKTLTTGLYKATASKQKSCSFDGFIAPNCRDCEKLSSLNVTDLPYIRCKECCLSDIKEDSSIKIQAFIQSDPVQKYPSLEIIYERGADPTLKLVEMDGTVKSFGIEAWTTDKLETFLLAHIGADGTVNRYS